MHYERKAVIFSVALWMVISMFYYNIFNLMQSYTTKTSENFNLLRPVYKRKIVPQFTGEEDFLIDTPGCTIPNYIKTLKLKEASNVKGSCYKQLVFVERSADDEITFRIDYNKTTKQKGRNFKCSYHFVLRSNVRGKEDFYKKFTQSKPFENGDKAKLVEEVIAVSCDLISKNQKKIFTYRDTYLILKKKRFDFLTTVEDNNALAKEDWNVLILGIDTMSRGRAYHSLPKTVKYLQKHGWLDYRGYQKVASNTFPNVMGILTGKNASTVWSECGRGMDYCEHSLIWNKFKQAGYMTAFGEDNLRLPDTFSPYRGFTVPPTDHYARTLFLMGEYHTGNIVCTGSKPSAKHLLDYSLQFTETYKHDKFFGYFWINSYSHNLDYLPTIFEDDLIAYFESLKSTGALTNTFVFFLSDHGIRFGPNRTPRESYYEERLPMLFMWVPDNFRNTYPEEYDNLQLNQFRFTTPYDLHATLLSIVTRVNNNTKAAPPEACPQCTSLTEEISPDRTCEMANVDQKWCTCHGMNKASTNDAPANKSIDVVVKYLQNRASLIETINCTVCSHLQLKRVLRNDSYKIGNITYYVIAIQFKPGDVAFEATVENYGDEYNILGPTDAITTYNVRGGCAKKKNDRTYCVCAKSKTCG